MTRRVITNARFVDELVDVTATNMNQCEFDGCIIQCHQSEAGVGAYGSHFFNCVFIGAGWPAEFKEVNNRWIPNAMPIRPAPGSLGTQAEGEKPWGDECPWWPSK